LQTIEQAPRDGSEKLGKMIFSRTAFGRPGVTDETASVVIMSKDYTDDIIKCDNQL
jgi:hypothetical protein